MPASVARRFFEETKHPSQIRHRNVMDWSNRPHPFKIYEGLEQIGLPRRPRPVGANALEAVATVSAPASDVTPSLDDLARILVYGAGVRRKLSHAGEDFHFRTYASAGALYPVEVYVCCTGLTGLSAGVYHFNPREPALVALREGDVRGYVARASGGESAISTAPVVLVLTGIPWRTSWKYTERGYRHLFWDAGMILANMLAFAASGGWTARLIMSFADSEVEALLGLDGHTEFPLALLAIGSGAPASRSSEPPEPIDFTTAPLSREVIEYPLITEVNDSGRHAGPDDATRWRAEASRLSLRAKAPGPLPPTSSDGIETVILRRGSAREFGSGAIPAEVLSDILSRATRGVSTDYNPAGSCLIEPYLIANAVEGLAPGAYVFRDAFHLLKSGEFRAQAGLLCLQQRLGHDAAATHFLFTDLNQILDVLGDRGYRAAELEAGIVAGRIYLGAYSHLFGATGLTFFDDPVTEFFSPEASGQNSLLVVAVGESPRLRRASAG